MSSNKSGEFEISFSSDIGFLDLVQSLSDNIGSMLGFDADSQYWIGLSLRESVINAIQHGNKEDRSKRVKVRFEFRSDRLVILVRDEGHGLKESDIPDPLQPDNLLKPGGRGIFFVRSFMDSVAFNVRPKGGLEVRMEKRMNRKSEGDENDD
ncbi:MAG TPA: ATP-binding protein [Acidobacteriota bacterium]|nr:ATP-binding protein [Acidobacteriota bacterium]